MRRGWRVDELVSLWADSLRAENKSPNTIRSYVDSVERFLEFCGTDPSQPTRRAVRAFLGDQLRRNSAGTAAIRHRSLRAWFKWLVVEGEIETDPMVGIPAPVVPLKPTHVLTDEELRRLLAACKGNRFFAIRDRAILRVFMSSGCRLSEVAGLRVSDVDVEAGCAYVVGKGRRPRTVGISAKAVEALRHYLVARERRAGRDEAALWLGKDGVLTHYGIAKMFARRAKAAGVEAHVHSLRHRFAHEMLSSGASEGDVMELGGWRNPAIMRRYGAALATQRALAAHARFAPGDRI